MKTLHLSIIIGIAIFGIIISVFLFSQYNISSQQNVKLQSQYYDEMQNAEVRSSIARLVKPENICFVADDTIFSKFPTFLTAMDDADNLAAHDISTNLPILENSYSATSASLTNNQVAELLGRYNFNHTTSFVEDDNHRFKFKEDYFRCGFEDRGNNYGLLIKYAKLVGTGTDFGYVPIIIDNKTTEHASFTVFGTFNNTIVFNNTLDSKVTFKITPNSTSQNITVPAHELALLYLRGNITNPGDVKYHYQANELPDISGDILLKLVPRCLDQNTMKSLYYQTGFALKFPTYLPNNFVPVCNEVSFESAAIERFANSTGIAQSKNLNFYHISANQHEDNGLIGVRAIIQYGKNATDLAYQDYKNDISIAYDNSTFSRYGDGSIMTYVAPGGVSTVVFTTKDQSYTFVGKIPLEELIKMAKSLS